MQHCQGRDAIPRCFLQKYPFTISGQCTYSYFPGVSATNTPLNILSKLLAAFRQQRY